MATTGTFLKDANFDGKNGSHFKESLYYTISQDIGANKSYITYYGYVGSIDGYSGGGSTATVEINGEQVGTFTSLSADSWDTLRGTKSVTINHNADGTATANYSMKTDTPWTLGDAYLDGSITLPRIPRQANITSAPDFNDEGNPTIRYSNPAGNSVSSLQACIGNSAGTYVYVDYRDISKTGDSYTFNLTTAERNALRNAIPNDTKLKVRFFVKTVIGGNTYYSASEEKEMRIVNGNPTFEDFTYTTNLSELTGNTHTIINNKTTATITISSANKAIANKGATMSRYSFVCGDKTVLANYSENDVTASLMNCNSDIIKVTAIDSRGFERTITTVDIGEVPTFRDYHSPTIASADVDREDGVESTVYLNAVFNFWNKTFGSVTNKIETINYRVKQSSQEQYSNWFTINTSELVIDRDTAKLEDVLIYLDGISTGFTVGTTYDIQIKVTDKVDATESGTLFLYDGKVAFSILKDNNGEYHIGINGMPDLNYTMKVHGTISNS